jgi:hypothetical protein
VSELLDARPAGLDAFFRPGDPFTAQLTWPPGELAGRVFTATLEGDPLGLTINGDVMTVTATAAQTSAGGGLMALVEHVVGDDPTVIIGRWAPSELAATSADTGVTVTNAAGAAQVTVAPVAAPQSSNLVTQVKITSPVTGLAVNVFQMAAVTGSVVTVPDLDVPVLLMGGGPLGHSVAQSDCALAIAVPGAGLGAWIGMDMAYAHTTGSRPSPKPQADLPAHSPGQYQLYVYSFTGGNMAVDAGSNNPGFLRVLALG